MAVLSFLDREHSIAGPDYSRWLVPPAALAIHLAIGQAYAFSVFNLPLSRLVGGADSTTGDWKLSTIGIWPATAFTFTSWPGEAPVLGTMNQGFAVLAPKMYGSVPVAASQVDGVARQAAVGFIDAAVVFFHCQL